ncbi:MAG: NAD(P)H-dependent oxidoreductase [Candidatus Hepatoplasma scabrum]|nr:MAG: NAD(P)H-dependent oxidoreductase [Candidatus Hepatoplasma sp.]
MELLEKLKKRKATKAYNSNQKIDQETLNYIFEFINSAPTSMGVEHWRVLDIKDSNLRKKLLDGFMEGNKQKFLDSSDALIFVTKNREWFTDPKNYQKLKEIGEAKSKAFIKEFNLKSTEAEIMAKVNEEIESLRTGKNLNVLVDNITEWSKRQAYIALGYALVAATFKNINSTPMEGFKKKLTELLIKENLISKHESVAVCLLMGYIDNTNHPTIGKEQIRINIKEKFLIK